MLHEKLKKLREFKGLTQDELAQALNLSRNAYSMYEINKRQMSHESLCVLADFYNVTTDYLLGRNEEVFLFSEYEQEMVIKYRELDERARQNVNTLICIEHDRQTNKKDLEKRAM